MKTNVALLILFLTVTLSANDSETKERTIYLKNGDQITGTIIKTDSQTGLITIQTKYGEITVQQENILEEVVTIALLSGDKLRGRIMSKDAKTTELLTDYGLLKINNTEIADINYGLQDKGKKVAEITDKFAQGSERQIDVFYDPTGYTLEKGKLYISGLSWGFGITDKFQVTSKWSGYLLGNFNIRPKLQLFRFGTFEREHTFSIGGHYHTRYNADKYEWIEKEYWFDNGFYDPSNEYKWTGTGDSTKVYMGGFYKIGTSIKIDENNRRYNTEYSEIDYSWVETDEPDYSPYYEVFAAYTFSKARSSGSGRTSHTFGAAVSKHPDKKEYMYKFYYAGGVDIRKNMILNYEIYYDPYYIEWWNRADGLFGYYDENLSTTRPEKPYTSPIHFDVGFIYAFTDWLRLGIHFQPYIFGVYMEF